MKSIEGRKKGEKDSDFRLGVDTFSGPHHDLTIYAVALKSIVGSEHKVLKIIGMSLRFTLLMTFAVHFEGQHPWDLNSLPSCSLVC